jgi:hypothetical protein
VLSFYDLYDPVLAHCPNLTHLDIGRVYSHPSHLAMLQNLPRLVPLLRCLRIRIVAPQVLLDPGPIVDAVRGLGRLDVVCMEGMYREELGRLDVWRDVEEVLGGRGGFVVWADEHVDVDYLLVRFLLFRVVGIWSPTSV